MADLALFDATPYVMPPPRPVKKLSAQRRRTLRQKAAIVGGLHPLSLALGYSIRLHPNAPRDRDGKGPRCGTCWYRRLTYTNGRKRWPKCFYGDERNYPSDPRRLNVPLPPPRISHGPGTDVRAWWPACEDYSPGDTRVSEDAARYIPEEAA